MRNIFTFLFSFETQELFFFNKHLISCVASLILAQVWRNGRALDHLSAVGSRDTNSLNKVFPNLKLFLIAKELFLPSTFSLWILNVDFSPSGINHHGYAKAPGGTRSSAREWSRVEQFYVFLAFCPWSWGLLPVAFWQQHGKLKVIRYVKPSRSSNGHLHFRGESVESLHFLCFAHTFWFISFSSFCCPKPTLFHLDIKVIKQKWIIHASDEIKTS